MEVVGGVCQELAQEQLTAWFRQRRQLAQIP
jgi:hypothetical protein